MEGLYTAFVMIAAVMASVLGIWMIANNVLVPALVMLVGSGLLCMLSTMLMRKTIW